MSPMKSMDLIGHSKFLLWLQCDLSLQRVWFAGLLLCLVATQVCVSQHLNTANFCCMKLQLKYNNSPTGIASTESNSLPV